MRLVVGMSGASGAIYGVRLLEVLRSLRVETHLVMSEWAETIVEDETGHTAASVRSIADHSYGPYDLLSAVASGSFLTDGMIVAPCSMKTLAGIASGYTDNLLLRAADVSLKERRKLVLLTRESPLGLIHLENMIRVTRAGGIIVPPVPSFYTQPTSVSDIVDQTVGRVLDLFGLTRHGLVQRWGEDLAHGTDCSEPQ
ncbi:MAG: UbiX family flavin prenyltransferase [Firmicutes bacterium]|jgi:4-hydroxy-3-polyprenylbenzoate decarboxylase|nr:UbiX family flavin prenyltransferase [Bacillota bacterium]